MSDTKQQIDIKISDYERSLDSLKRIMYEDEMQTGKEKSKK